MDVQKNRQPDPEFELSLLLDDALSDEQAQRLQADLADDEQLQEALRQYESLDAHLADLAGEIDIDDDDLTAQRLAIHDAIERESLLEGAPKRKRNLIFRPMFWAPLAAAAALLIVVTAVLRQPGPPTGTTGNGPRPIANMRIVPSDGNGGDEGKAVSVARASVVTDFADGAGRVTVGAVEIRDMPEAPWTTRAIDASVPSGTIFIGAETDEEVDHNNDRGVGGSALPPGL